MDVQEQAKARKSFPDEGCGWQKSRLRRWHDARGRTCNQSDPISTRLRIHARRLQRSRLFAGSPASGYERQWACCVHVGRRARDVRDTDRARGRKNGHRRWERAAYTRDVRSDRSPRQPRHKQDSVETPHQSMVDFLASDTIFMYVYTCQRSAYVAQWQRSSETPRV